MMLARGHWRWPNCGWEAGNISFKQSFAAGSMHLETELKFIGSEEAISQLRRSAELRRIAGNRRAHTRTLNAVYFDTENFALRKAGLVLRVRSEGQSFVQTLKSSYRDDLATRSEYKADVDSHTPDVSAIPDSRMRWRVSQLLKGHTLKAIFEVETKRTRVLLTPKRGTEIEAAFDTGLIRYFDGDHAQSLPISEFELELLKGNVDDLFATAHALTDELPVTLSLLAKSERGYGLARGEVGKPVQAKPVKLAESMTADDALCVVIASCLHHLLGNWSAVTIDGDSEGIHQMRVALRRLRVALSMLETPVQSPMAGLLEQARETAAVLGRARDLDVFLEEIIAPVTEVYSDERQLQELTSHVLARRRLAREQVVAVLDSDGFRKFVLQLAAVTYQRPWLARAEHNDAVVRGAYDFSCAQLSYRLSRAMRTGEQIEDLDAQERHDLRIKLKKLRYTADFFGSLFSGKKVRRYLKRLSRLQQLLGDMNDAATARALVHNILVEQRDREAPLDLAYAGGLVVGWHGSRSVKRSKALKQKWRRFTKLKPFWV